MNSVPEVTGDSAAIFEGYKWYGVPASGPDYEMSPREQFIAGERYRLDVNIKSRNGRYFSDTVPFLINRNRAQKREINGLNERKAILSYTFKAKPNEIQNVNVRVEKPMEGNLPGIPIAVTEGLEVRNFTWHYMNNGIVGSELLPGDRFLPGLDYCLDLVIATTGDRKIKKYALIEVNGEINNRSPYYTYDKEVIYTKHTFTAEGDPNARYTVTVTDPIPDGRVIADRDMDLLPGDIVTLTVLPDAGYKLDYLQITDDGTNVVPMASENTFKMPWSHVNVDASFSPLPLDAVEVRFATNGGSAVLTQVLAKGDTARVPTEPVRYGYIFGGWYEDAGFTVPFDFSAGVMNDIIVYAKWDEIPAPEVPTAYTVTFEANGHGTSFTQNVEDGRRAVRPSDLDEAGYRFEGWYMEAACINEYDFTLPVTGDITVYAKWSERPASEIPEVYMVRFDGNGHGGSSSQSVNKGESIPKPEDPAEEGYIFEGWYKEAECINEYDFTEAVTGNITIFAKWTKIGGADDDKPDDDRDNKPDNDNRQNNGDNQNKGDNQNNGGNLNNGDNNSNKGNNNQNNGDNPVATPSQINPGGGSRGGGSGRGGSSGGGGTRSRRSLVGSDTAKKQGQWQQDAIGWWYKYTDGTYPKNTWQDIDGIWYAFNEGGYMRTGWFLDGGKWYYLDPVQGGMKTGWQVVESNWYFFDTAGSMRTGWLSVSDKWYYLETEGRSGKSQGAMYFDEKTPDGYNVNSSGEWIK